MIKIVIAIMKKQVYLKIAKVKRLNAQKDVDFNICIKTGEIWPPATWLSVLKKRIMKLLLIISGTWSTAVEI